MKNQIGGIIQALLNQVANLPSNGKNESEMAKQKLLSQLKNIFDEVLAISKKDEEKAAEEEAQKILSLMRGENFGGSKTPT